MHRLSKSAEVTSWVLRLIVAGILLQTLHFKFTAAPESVYIFSKLGLEPWGRIGSGIAELVAAMLLLIPRTVICGALLAMGVITGAIISHLSKLGIVVQDDGGLLFALALVIFIGSLFIIVIHYAELRSVGPDYISRLISSCVGKSRLSVAQPQRGE